MKIRAYTFLATAASAGLFGWGVPLIRLFDAFQPISVALSIMIAAVFVRLNRGMPSLEWKSLDPGERSNLTEKIVELTAEYGWIIGLNALTLIGIVTLSAIGKEQASLWPMLVKHLVAGGIGGLTALCCARMAYVVWRDIDIVRLQKRLIDGLAARESFEFETKSADDKVAMIRAAGLRKVEVSSPKAWGE